MLIKPKVIPSTPGVYIFSRHKKPLYIGKAAYLKKRLASYFAKNANQKAQLLCKEADALTWTEATSEIEALITEALLIKKHLPKYNILMRDDKSYFYVGITRDRFPRIFTVHQLKTAEIKSYARMIGPFTSGRILREVLWCLRGIFPYCTCLRPHPRLCTNAHIGRCLGYCCVKNTPISADQETQCQTNVTRIEAILMGRKTKIAKDLIRAMKNAAREERFEHAVQLRDTLEGLERIFHHHATRQILPRRMTPSLQWPSLEPKIRLLIGRAEPITRVEGYDISNISGAYATGSLVVFHRGKPDKSSYRMFRIKTIRASNDVAMHQEVMRRRLSHTEWPLPELMIIDGGKPQLHAVARILATHAHTRSITLTALAKREEELYISGFATPAKLQTLPREILFFFQRVRDESHRFAKKYHHKLRELSYRAQAHA
ncbi:MAG: hypothetical protein G01um101466_440 [Parcubacteria group bacterium Gr01-1014_66]|nr:MAG: hypothetical protein G01um101466_440 [Parcubacteria group bacterium Gr01-1014_66]